MNFWQWLRRFKSNWECQCAAPLEAGVTLSAGVRPKLPFKTLPYWSLAVRLVEKRVGGRQIAPNVRFPALDVSFPRWGTSRVQIRYKRKLWRAFFLTFFLSFLSGEQLWLMSNTATRCEGVSPHTRWCNKSNQIITSNQCFRISVAPSYVQTLHRAETYTAKTKTHAAVFFQLSNTTITLLLKLWHKTSQRLRLSDPKVTHIVHSRKAFNHGKTCRKTSLCSCSAGSVRWRSESGTIKFKKEIDYVHILLMWWIITNGTFFTSTHEVEKKVRETWIQMLCCRTLTVCLPQAAALVLSLTCADHWQVGVQISWHFFFLF